MLGVTPLLFTVFIAVKELDIRQRMEKKLGSQELQTLLIPANEVNWMDTHEIWVNNHLFDIQSKKLENGIYVFTGLVDEEETILVENERKATGKNNDQHRLLVQLFKSLSVYCYGSTEYNYLRSQQAGFTTINEQDPVNQYREILIPPPQC